MKKAALLKIVIISCVVVGLLIGLTVYARDVSYRRHPNLAEAQTLIQRAIDRVSAAQRDHEWDLGGHASKAKALLDEAYTEIKLAAEAANR
jgi:hypothetical protein